MDKTSTKQRGLRMAMQVAALSLGAGAAAMALAASEAKADDSTSATSTEGPAAGPEPIHVTGWSCWGPTSRGPLAPPAQSDEDFNALLDEVPA